MARRRARLVMEDWGAATTARRELAHMGAGGTERLVSLPRPTGTRQGGLRGPRNQPGGTPTRMGATSSSMRHKCFAHAAGQLVAQRKGRVGLSGQALRTSSFSFTSSLWATLSSQGGISACLEVAVHRADWQARVWDASSVVGWHIKRTINKSVQDLPKGWRIRAAEA